jgi:hypothetical protein
MITNMISKCLHFLVKVAACVIAVFVMAGMSTAQDNLIIRFDRKHKPPIAEAERVYRSACTAVQREFESSRSLRPRITLVLGAEKDVLDFDRAEIRLAKWDPYLFSQGVVVLAFEELMPKRERLLVARRAVNWANSTIDVASIEK